MAELERCIQQDPFKIYRTFAPTLRLLEEYCEKPATAIDLAHIFAETTILGFRPFIRKNTTYSPGSANTHVARYTTLRRHAEDYGYRRDDIPESWQELYTLAKEARCPEYADHFAKIATSPGDVTVEAIKDFTLFLANNGFRTYGAAVARRNRFLSLLRKCGFAEQQPLAAAREKDYGTPVEKFPLILQNQTEILRLSMVGGAPMSALSSEWKPQPWDVATPEDLKREESNGTRRERTAGAAVEAISGIYGYLHNICDLQVDSMEQLVTKDHLFSFRNFSLRARQKSGDSVRNPLAILFAALRRCKHFENLDLSWADELLDGIPRTSPGERAKNKEERALSLEELDSIPDLIRADRKRAESRLNAEQAREQKLGDSRSLYRRRRAERSFRSQIAAITRLVMAEFLFRFLTTWPWRGSNLCECRIKPAKNPNLFKAPLRLTAGMKIPADVAKIRAANPNAEFWQVYISAAEHKTGRTTGKEINAIYPGGLVGSLEEFLRYRQTFLEVLGVPDPGILLINMDGAPLRLPSFEHLVQDIAVRYGNAPMSPHLFRDAIADECMEKHPQDSEHVAKGMFHSSDKTMKRSYATRHNASVGANFLDEQARIRREKRQKQSTITPHSNLRRNTSWGEDGSASDPRNPNSAT